MCSWASALTPLVCHHRSMSISQVRAKHPTIRVSITRWWPHMVMWRISMRYGRQRPTHRWKRGPLGSWGGCIAPLWKFLSFANLTILTPTLAKQPFCSITSGLWVSVWQRQRECAIGRNERRIIAVNITSVLSVGPPCQITRACVLCFERQRDNSCL